MAVIPRPITHTVISSPAWGIPLTDQVNANTTDVAAMKADTGWTNVTYQNGWSDQGFGWAPLSYRKIGTIVYLRGLCKGGAVGSVICTLPAGFRPAIKMMFNCIAKEGATPTLAEIVVFPSGNMSHTFGDANFLSWDGYCYIGEL